MADPFIAEIVMFGGNFAPRGWAFCEGQLLPIAQNSALFSILGTTYGGDGRVTFALPDLRGRVPIQQGSGPGLPTYRLGERSGNPTTTLTAPNLPAHNHTLLNNANEQTADQDNPDGNVLAEVALYSDQGATVRTNPAQTGNNTTSNSSFSNMPPFLAINFIIALVGVFPSRN